MLKVFKLLLLVLVVLPFTMKAQETELQLDPVTITTTLTPISSSKTGRNIIVIQGKDIMNLPIHSIDDVLRYVPGLEVQSRGPMGIQSDFVMRGSTFQQILFIVDGIRVNEPLTGHLNSYIPISPEEIERIEILKGASSAIYGSDAVGGVIHIITKTFSAQQNQQSSDLSAQVIGGEYNLLNAQAGGYYNSGKTAVSAGISTNNSTGQPLRNAYGYFNLNTASLSVKHYLNDYWQLGYRSSLDSRSFSAQNFYTFSAIDHATEKVQTFWNQMRIVYKKEKNKFTLDGGFKNLEDEFYFTPASTPNFNHSKLFQGLATLVHELDEKTDLILGLQYQKRTIASNDRGNHDINQGAAFFILQKQIGKNLQVNPAVRVDKYDMNNAELVPQINASYSLNNVQLRGNAGKSLRYGDFTEHYNNYNKSTVSAGQRIGNPELSAETSLNFEIGADVYLKSLSISTSIFQRTYTDMIDYILTNYNQMPRKSNLVPGADYLLAKNVINTQTLGVELDVQYKKYFSQSQQLRLNAGVIWLDASNNQKSPSLYLLSFAKLLTNFSLSYNVKNFSLNFNGLYKVRDPQSTKDMANALPFTLNKDYLLLNGKVAYYFLPKKASVFVEVDNVLNKEYSDVLGAKMPDRWLMGGLNIKLSKD